jgi:two-component system cell cycle sensor histidine kinase/response regulator CckA
VRFPIRNRIVYWILFPVLGMGVVLGIVLIAYALPHLVSHYTSRVDADLKLATQMGLSACENNFDYLLELRLDADLQMNLTLKREAIEEIKNISRNFDHIQLLVIENNNRVAAASLDVHDLAIKFPDWEALPRSVSVQNFWGQPLRVHQRYFPFWNWRIVSFITEANHLAPIRHAAHLIYLCVFLLLTLLTATLYAAFLFFVDRPIKRVIDATGQVADGRYPVLAHRGSDEISQLVAAFNAMMHRLEKKDADVNDLLNALRTSESRFRTLYESAPLGIGLAETNGQMLECNGAMLHLLGCPAASIHRMRLPALFQNTEQSRLLEEKLSTNAQFRNFEADLVRPDGTVYNARLTLSPMQIANETVALVLAEDVTREKQLEAQLQRAQKMEAIGTLAGGVAHDLNNILSAMLGYPELLLLDLPADSKMVPSLKAIRLSGEKAAAIVQDLLTLARRGVAITEVINLNRIVEDYLENPVLEKLRAFHPGLVIETRLEKELLNVRGSSIHLSKTLMNLVSNAAEAMPQGGTVTIATENHYMDHPILGYDQVAEGDYATLIVSDTGEGIAPEDIDRIFEPFFTKKVMGYSGTGLGMAVVWGTVKDHNGYIDVQSTQGVGTTFTLYFPVTRDAIEEETEPFTISGFKGRGEKILVVDDMDEQRRLASSMLSRLGYVVDTAPSGEAAVEAVSKQPVDLLVLDMIMDPGIDGLETFRRIKAVQKNVKAIIASGFSETNRVRETQELGAGAYIKKPYTLEKLAKSVRKALDRQAV